MTPVPGQSQGEVFAYEVGRIIVSGEAGVVIWQGLNKLFKRETPDTEKLKVMGINPQENGNKLPLLNMMRY
jgi:hypothetical protein